MNLKRFKVAFAMILMVGTVFTACSGEDGAIGPEGATGNANVQSNTYTVLSGDWRQPIVNSAFQQDTIAIAGITSNVVNSGAVHVYQTFSMNSDSLVWNAMPYRYLTVASGVITNMNLQASYNVGELYLRAYTDDRYLGTIADMMLKVIIIPSSAKVDGVDINNYEEVKAVYGIKEIDLN